MDDTECCTCWTCKGKLVPRGAGLIYATRDFVNKRLDELRKEMMDHLRRAMNADDEVIDFNELRRHE